MNHRGEAVTFNVGPELAAVLLSLIAAIGAWLSYVQGRTIKKEVNGTSHTLAKRAVEREERLVELERENAMLKAKQPGGS